jgi:hypothetical protein
VTPSLYQTLGHPTSTDIAGMIEGGETTAGVVRGMGGSTVAPPSRPSETQTQLSKNPSSRMQAEEEEAEDYPRLYPEPPSTAALSTTDTESIGGGEERAPMQSGTPPRVPRVRFEIEGDKDGDKEGALTVARKRRDRPYVRGRSDRQPMAAGGKEKDISSSSEEEPLSPASNRAAVGSLCSPPGDAVPREHSVVASGKLQGVKTVIT